MTLSKQELEERFGFKRKPDITAEESAAYIEHATLTQIFYGLAARINEQVPDGRAKSLAFTDLEQALMWMNKAIEGSEVVIPLPQRPIPLIMPEKITPEQAEQIKEKFKRDYKPLGWLAIPPEAGTMKSLEDVDPHTGDLRGPLPLLTDVQISQNGLRASGKIHAGFTEAEYLEAVTTLKMRTRIDDDIVELIPHVDPGGPVTIVISQINRRGTPPYFAPEDV